MKNGGYQKMGVSENVFEIPKEDPFFVVKKKVHKDITSLTSDFSLWKDLLENSNTDNTDFEKLTKSCKRACTKIKIDLNDLRLVVGMIDENRIKFSNINDTELNTRRTFVNDMSVTVQDVEETLTSSRTTKKIESDKKARKVRLTREKMLSREMNRENNKYIDHKRQEEQLLETKQDIILDDMSAALSRLGDVSNTIGTQLEEHNEIISDMDRNMDDVNSNMSKALRGMEKLLGRSNKGKYACICIEVVVIVILITLIAYV